MLRIGMMTILHVCVILSLEDVFGVDVEGDVDVERLLLSAGPRFLHFFVCFLL